jgi:hypothetical protein
MTTRSVTPAGPARPRGPSFSAALLAYQRARQTTVIDLDAILSHVDGMDTGPQRDSLLQLIADMRRLFDAADEITDVMGKALRLGLEYLEAMRVEMPNDFVTKDFLDPVDAALGPPRGAPLRRPGTTPSERRGPLGRRGPAYRRAAMSHEGVA